jgi:hypothetical protein
MAKWKKTCKNPECRERFLPERPGQDACGKVECLVVVGRMKREKINARLAADKKRAERKKDAETRERLMTINQRMDRAQKIVNKWIRLVRDIDDPCISCGTPRAKWDAGHYRTVGHGGAALRFVEDNIHKQCAQCNQDKAGNTIEFRKGLLRKWNGDEDRIKALEADPPPFKPTVEWVENIRAVYTARLKAAGIKI